MRYHFPALVDIMTIASSRRPVVAVQQTPMVGGRLTQADIAYLDTWAASVRGMDLEFRLDEGCDGVEEVLGYGPEGVGRWSIWRRLSDGRLVMENHYDQSRDAVVDTMEEARTATWETNAPGHVEFWETPEFKARQAAIRREQDEEGALDLIDTTATEHASK